MDLSDRMASRWQLLSSCKQASKIEGSRPHSCTRNPPFMIKTLPKTSGQTVTKSLLGKVFGLIFSEISA